MVVKLWPIITHPVYQMGVLCWKILGGFCCLPFCMMIINNDSDATITNYRWTKKPPDNNENLTIFWVIDHDGWFVICISKNLLFFWWVNATHSKLPGCSDNNTLPGWLLSKDYVAIFCISKVWGLRKPSRVRNMLRHLYCPVRLQEGERDWN